MQARVCVNPDLLLGLALFHGLGCSLVAAMRQAVKAWGTIIGADAMNGA